MNVEPLYQTSNAMNYNIIGDIKTIGDNLICVDCLGTIRKSYKIYGK